MVANAPAGAGPLLAGNLVSTGVTPGVAYDSHGDTTTLADQALGYDQTGRHITTTTPDTAVVYTRDVAGQAVAMATTTGGTTTTVGYSTGGGVLFTIDPGTGAVVEGDLTLPGGATYSLSGAGQVWSYPDLHGDDTATADGTGTRTGSTTLYDPFGNPIDPATGLIGTATANGDVPDNSTTAGTAYGWEGTHQKQYQHSSPHRRASRTRHPGIRVVVEQPAPPLRTRLPHPDRDRAAVLR